jgi:hypothetical protein
MESFFSSLKTERTARKFYRTRNEARADVFDYIEQDADKESPKKTIEAVSCPMVRNAICVRQFHLHLAGSVLALADFRFRPLKFG